VRSHHEISANKNHVSWKVLVPHMIQQNN